MTQLFIIGTPIGNLGDISKRVVESLEKADIVFAEDTRTALNLLNHLGIKKRIESCHKDNEKTATARIISEINADKTIALVSEAGMPCISDPGSEVVKAAIENYIKFEIIQGPTALIQGLIASGMAGGSFYFHGFLQHKTQDKRKELERLKSIRTPIIFYESPHRLKDTLKLLLEHFPAPVACARELTKMFEETVFIRNEEDIENIMLKGEFVLTIDNSVCGTEEENESGVDYASIASELAKEGLSNQDIVKVLKTLGMKRNDAYRLVNGQ